MVGSHYTWRTVIRVKALGILSGLKWEKEWGNVGFIISNFFNRKEKKNERECFQNIFFWKRHTGHGNISMHLFL